MSNCCTKSCGEMCQLQSSELINQHVACIRCYCPWLVTIVNLIQCMCLNGAIKVVQKHRCSNGCDVTVLGEPKH